MAQQISTTQQQVLQVFNETSLSSFPMELLEYIFSFLHRDDLLRAMSVCTNWQSLIKSSPNLWRSQTFIFDCSLHVKKKKKVDMLFCTQNFGPHFQTLSVRCRHTDVPNCDCTKMAQQVHLFLTGLRSPELTSFKVYDLQLLQWFCPNKIVPKQISSKLIQMLSSGCRLKVFKMPDTRWPVTEGRQVLDIVFQNSRNTLETLNIAEYFYAHGRFPATWDWFATGLTSLTNLTKLSISLFYLTDELIVSLARVRRGQLAKLSLTANFELWNFHIEQDSWKCLLKACPNIKVSFKIVGYVDNPRVSISALFDSVLPVTKLQIKIPHDSYSRDLPEMGILLEHVRTHYGPWLKSFILVVNNKKEENFDQSLIKLVRDCPHLALVKALVSYYSEDTVKIINRMVSQRRQPPTRH
ncbi:F-box only protein 39 [Biomphalaria pfeifferi]|uniref:F-box only protein 39 n=1 Tax=Biomphalaria pfeifferi TaxID=112525 RepID=A0AAD8F594_BIOPF|nr:F-box only protein 39 [Biomphalaria pfeifferi]